MGSGSSADGVEESSAPNSRWVGLLAGAAIVGASLLPVPVMTLLVAAIASSITFELARGLVRRGVRARKWTAVSLSIGFAILVAFQGETGLLFGATLTSMVLAAAYMSGRVEARSVPALAASIACVLYVGFTCSYLILIRGLNSGPRLMAAFVVMVVLFRISLGSVSKLHYAEMAPGSGSDLSWPVAAVGVLGSMVGALIASPLLNGSVGLLTMLVLGLLVGIAGVIGELGSVLLTSADAHPPTGAARQLFAQLIPTLLAAPAFFYGIRLYLT